MSGSLAQPRKCQETESLSWLLFWASVLHLRCSAVSGVVSSPRHQQPEASHHFVFISHYKAEAGTTAALMQDARVRVLFSLFSL